MIRFLVSIGIVGLFMLGCLLISIGVASEFKLLRMDVEGILLRIKGILYLIAGLVSLLVAVCAFGFMAMVRNGKDT